MIAQIVYTLCGLTSIGCAVLLFRRYRTTRARLLFWSTWCFVCLAITNVLLFLDRVVLPDVNLLYARSIVTLIGLLMLLWSLVNERT